MSRFTQMNLPHDTSGYSTGQDNVMCLVSGDQPNPWYLHFVMFPGAEMWGAAILFNLITGTYVLSVNRNFVYTAPKEVVLTIEQKPFFVTFGRHVRAAIPREIIANKTVFITPDMGEMLYSTLNESNEPIPTNNLVAAGSLINNRLRQFDNITPIQVVQANADNEIVLTLPVGAAYAQYTAISYVTFSTKIHKLTAKINVGKELTKTGETVDVLEPMPTTFPIIGSTRDENICMVLIHLKKIRQLLGLYISTFGNLESYVTLISYLFTFGILVSHYYGEEFQRYMLEMIRTRRQAVEILRAILRNIRPREQMVHYINSDYTVTDEYTNADRNRLIGRRIAGVHTEEYIEKKNMARDAPLDIRYVVYCKKWLNYLIHGTARVKTRDLCQMMRSCKYAERDIVSVYEFRINRTKEYLARRNLKQTHIERDLLAAEEKNKRRLLDQARIDSKRAKADSLAAKLALKAMNKLNNPKISTKDKKQIASDNNRIKQLAENALKPKVVKAKKAQNNKTVVPVV
jgi:hypothetical protein